jgi:hypothetical protein
MGAANNFYLNTKQLPRSNQASSRTCRSQGRTMYSWNWLACPRAPCGISAASSSISSTYSVPRDLLPCAFKWLLVWQRTLVNTKMWLCSPYVIARVEVKFMTVWIPRTLYWHLSTSLWLRTWNSNIGPIRIVIRSFSVRCLLALWTIDCVLNYDHSTCVCSILLCQSQVV